MVVREMSPVLSGVRKFMSGFVMVLCCSACALPSDAQSPAVREAFERGAAAMRSGQSAAAELAFRDAVRLAPGMAEAHLDLGLVLGREGKFEEAIRSVQKSIALNPGQSSAHMFLGIFLFQANRPEEARKALQAEIASDPKNAEALTWLGNVEMATGHAERAVGPLDRAAELTPDDANLLEARGKAHSQVAHDSYARMAKLDPNSWHVHRVQAQLFSDEGKHAEAAAEYQAAIKLEPRNPDLYEGLGDEFRAAAQLEAAQGAYEKELALAPANPVAIYNVGSVKVDRGDAAAGVPLLLSMVKAYPGSPVVEYFLGRGLASLGRDQEAVTWLRQSAGADANGEIGKRSWYELTRLYRKLHQTADAETALNNYNRIRETQEAQKAQQDPNWNKLTQPPG